MTSGNSRSKVSSRKTSQIQPGGKQNQVFVPQNPMGNSLYSGFEANNLVNFYNSNLLDEMLSKNNTGGNGGSSKGGANSSSVVAGGKYNMAKSYGAN